MSAAWSDRQAILASFADEIQPLLAMVASSLDRLVEQPHDALAATTGLAQLQTLRASASLMAIEGFEALLETARTALETVIGGAALGPAQQRAGRELGDLLVREGEALGQAEPAPAPPPRAAELLVQLRAGAGSSAIATAAPPATDDLEGWLGTLTLDAEPTAEELAATTHAAAPTEANDERALADQIKTDEWLVTVMPAPADDARAAAAEVTTEEWVVATEPPTDDAAALEAAALGPVEPVAAEFAAADLAQIEPEAAEPAAPEQVAFEGQAVDSAVPELASPEVPAIGGERETSESETLSSNLQELLAALNDISGTPIPSAEQVEASVAWQAADEPLVDTTAVDLDSLLGTLGADAPADAAAPELAAPAAPAAEDTLVIEAARDYDADLVIEAAPVVADELAGEAVPDVAAELTAEATRDAEPDLADAPSPAIAAELTADTFGPWSYERNGTHTAESEPVAACPAELADGPVAEFAAGEAPDMDATLRLADAEAAGAVAPLADAADVDSIAPLADAAEVDTTDPLTVTDAAIAPASDATKPLELMGTASAAPSHDAALAELLVALQEVTGQPVSAAERAEMTTAWGADSPTTAADAAMTSHLAALEGLGSTSPSSDDTLALAEDLPSFDNLLTTLEADSEPATLDTDDDPATLTADGEPATAEAPTDLPEPLITLAEAIVTTPLAAGWPDEPAASADAAACTEPTLVDATDSVIALGEPAEALGALGEDSGAVAEAAVQPFWLSDAAAELPLIETVEASDGAVAELSTTEPVDMSDDTVAELSVAETTGPEGDAEAEVTLAAALDDGAEPAEVTEVAALATADADALDDGSPLGDAAFADLLATLDAGAEADAPDADGAPTLVEAANRLVHDGADAPEVELFIANLEQDVPAWAAESAAALEWAIPAAALEPDALAAASHEAPAGADNPEALAVFASERVRLVEAVAEARGALEVAPDDEMALIDLTWATHTLRGAASLVGADAISTVCGLVERAIEQFGAQSLPVSAEGLAFLATAEAILQELIDAPVGADDMIALLMVQYEALQGPSDEAPSAPASAGWGDLPPELAAELEGVDVTELDEETLARLAAALEAHDTARGITADAPAAFDAAASDEAPAAFPELIADDLAGGWALPTEVGAGPLGGAPLSLAADADFDAELREIFLGEAEEHLATINGALLALEATPGDAARLIAVRRAVHTLKSASGAVGLEAVSAFCHVWEDALECVEEETGAEAPELSLLLECAEALEAYFRDVTADPTAAEAAFAPLIDRLRAAAGEAPEAAPLASLAPGRESEAPEEPEASWGIPASGVVLGDAPLATTLPEADEAGDAAAELAPAARTTAEPRGSGETLRVPLGRVDGMIDLVGELVLQRSGLVQRLEALRLGVDDLAPSLERLRRLSVDLEDRFAASDDPRGLARRLGIATGSAAEFDELEFDRYNATYLLARELNELAADLATTRRELGHLVEDARLAVTRQGRVTVDLHDELLDARLVPLSQLTLRLQRTVRQAALKSRKEVTFALEGGDTLLDKTLLEQIADPLLHLLRNAVDHGIEPTDARVQAGKAPTGSVRVVAGRDGNEVVVQVCDDGAGIDAARVLAQARARGLVEDHVADDPALAHELIFAPGLSTSSTLTDLSGRGIGLDAVRAHLARAKGTVTVSSEPGQGTVFTLRLPSLLVVTPSLVVAAHGQRLALPLAQVRHVLRVTPEQILTVGDTRLLPLDGDNLRIRPLSGLLGWPADDDAAARRSSLLLVVVAVGERQVALEVDDVLGQQETVVKTPAPPFDVLPGLAGASVQGNGEVLLVLNLLELVAEPGGRPRGVPLPPPPASALEPPTVLVVDDSLSVRRVVVRALERHGWRAHEARDGVHALEVLRQVSPDVVLLDIEMPRMDGYELAGILKKQESFQGIPIVMLTSRGGERHRRKAFDLGVDAYLVKPYQEAELLRILRQVALAVPAVVA